MLSKRTKRIIYVTIVAVFLFLFGIFGADRLFGPGEALSYDGDIAHPSIVELAAQLYNVKFDPDLTREQINWMKQGAVDEDMPTRWLNHFYDPINNRGVLWSGIRYQSSKAWSQDPFNQANYSLGDNSWQRAFNYYYYEDYKNAFIALGHTLHLIADASVPAHTRDDPHPVGDSYEQFVKSNWDKLVPDIKKSAKFQEAKSLDSVFDTVAKFSNGNFYSNDTIEDNNYVDPIKGNIKEFETADGVDAYYINKNGSNLLIWTSSRSKSWKDNLIYDLKQVPLNDTVLNSYSQTILPQAVGYTAGVIKLFLEKAEAQEMFDNKLPLLSMNLNGLFDMVKGAIINKVENIWNKIKGTAGESVGAEAPGELSSAPVISTSPVSPVIPSVVEESLNNTPPPPPVVNEPKPLILPIPLPTQPSAPAPALEAPVAPPTPIPEAQTPSAPIPVVVTPPVLPPPPLPLAVAPSGPPLATNSSPAPSAEPGSEIESEPESESPPAPPAGESETSSTTPETPTTTPEVTSTTTYFTLTYTSGSGGYLTGSTTQVVAEGELGEEIIATPTSSFYFVSWSDSVTNSNRVDLATDNLSVEAIFATSTFALNYLADSNGSVTGSSTQIIEYGASGTTVTATPISGYHFVSWSDGVTSTGRVDVNIVADLSFTAIFAENVLEPVADIIINEIAWAGTDAGHLNNEWIELYNTTDEPIVFTWSGTSPWYLRVNGVNIGAQKVITSTIPAHGYYIFERTYDDTVRTIKADYIFNLSGGINDAGAKVELIAPSGEVVDSVDCSDGWFAGGGPEFRSMERLDEFSPSNVSSTWQSNQGPRFTPRTSNGGLIYGSPKASNFGLIALIGNQLEDNLVLTASNSPYIVSGAVVPIGKTMTIGPGAVLKSYDFTSNITVYGTLIVSATADNPAIFTSGRDQSFVDEKLNEFIGNYTTGTVPAAKDWQGFWFKAGSTGELDNAVIRYAGKNFYPNGYIYTTSVSEAIRVENATVTINNSTLSDDGIVFIHVLNDSNLTVQNTIFSNGTTAIKAESSITDLSDNQYNNIAPGV